MADEVLENIVADLRKRGTFGGFNYERMHSLLDLLWTKVECALKDSRKYPGQLEECSYSKGMKSLFNGRDFKYHFGGGRFHMLPHPYKFSHGLFFNNLFQVCLIGYQGMCNKVDCALKDSRKHPGDGGE